MQIRAAALTYEPSFRPCIMTDYIHEASDYEIPGDEREQRGWHGSV